MRITKSSVQVNATRAAAFIANAGCNRCPCCGETGEFINYLKQGIMNKGISGGIEKTWSEGFFHTKFLKCDCYSCYTCGAQWESEPYEYM